MYSTNRSDFHGTHHPQYHQPTHLREALPSIRALAKDLRISVITTKRAYDELEADGFLYTVAGKGCFVAEKNLDLIREQKLKELEDHLDAAVELAAQCGVSASELMEMLRILLKEEEPHV